MSAKQLTYRQAWKLEDWWTQTLCVGILALSAWSILRLILWAFGHAHDVDPARILLGLTFAWSWLQWIYWRRRAREAEKRSGAPDSVRTWLHKGEYVITAPDVAAARSAAERARHSELRMHRG